MDEFRRIYEASFMQPEAQLALLEAEELCRASATALMCYLRRRREMPPPHHRKALEEKGLKRKEILFRA